MNPSFQNFSLERTVDGPFSFPLLLEPLAPLVKSRDSCPAAAADPSDSYQQRCLLIIDPPGQQQR